MPTVIVNQVQLRPNFQAPSHASLAAQLPEDIAKMAILPRIAREMPHAGPAGLHLALARVAHQQPE